MSRFSSPANGSIGVYLLSLPERTLRSAAALSAGFVREVGNIVLPSAIRRTKIYQTMVESTLRFLVEQVGQVGSIYSTEDALAEKFLLKRTLGDGIDFIGIVAFHASPVWILAALADISGAGRQLVDEISSSLKEDGLLDRSARFETVDQLLDGLERTAGQLATSIRFPPLDVAGLRKEWNSLRDAARTIPQPNLPSPDFVQERWEELKQTAADQQRTVLELSSLMALSAARAVPSNLLWLSRCAHGHPPDRAIFRGGLDGSLSNYAYTSSANGISCLLEERISTVLTCCSRTVRAGTPILH